MCCGDSLRSSGGGTLAVLKSPCGSAPDLNLHFAAGESCTLATVNGPIHSGWQHEAGSLDIQIHRDGDLRLDQCLNQPLHSFSLDLAQHGWPANAANMRVPFAMNLAVGGDGVIGRRVLAVCHTPDGRSVVRQGIIGYN